MRFLPRRHRPSRTRDLGAGNLPRRPGRAPGGRRELVRSRRVRASSRARRCRRSITGTRRRTSAGSSSSPTSSSSATSADEARWRSEASAGRHPSAATTWPATSGSGAPPGPVASGTSSAAPGTSRPTPTPRRTRLSPWSRRRRQRLPVRPLHGAASRLAARARRLGLAGLFRREARFGRSVPELRELLLVRPDATSRPWSRRWKRPSTGGGRRSPSPPPTATSACRRTSSFRATRSRPTRRSCSIPPARRWLHKVERRTCGCRISTSSCGADGPSCTPSTRAPTSARCRSDVEGPNEWRDLVVQQVKDFRRSLDYLETPPGHRPRAAGRARDQRKHRGLAAGPRRAPQGRRGACRRPPAQQGSPPRSTPSTSRRGSGSPS